MKATNRTHQNTLAMWNPDNRVLERVFGSGFDVVYQMGSSMRPDMNLFMSFVHCYSLEHSCFILGGTMITPTLDDVARIMGLPIDGKPVTGRDYKGNECEQLCRELLGSSEFASGKSKSQIKVKSLHDLRDVPEDVSDGNLDMHVRAFVLHVIGCLVCPSVDASRMPSMFLSVVRNVEEIKNFAWGAAFLAHSMNQIKLFKALTNHTVVAACVPFFMVFLFEYVDGIALASFRRETQLNLPSEFPLVVSWSILSIKFTRDNYNKLDQALYDVLLHKCVIVFRPFDRLSPDFLPAHLQAQMDVAYTHTPLICFEQITSHTPHVCPAKMGLIVDDIVPLPALPEFHNVKRTYPKKQDWAARFAQQIESWNDRRLHYICSPQRLSDLGIIAPIHRNDDVHNYHHEDDEETTGRHDEDEHEHHEHEDEEHVHYEHHEDEEHGRYEHHEHEDEEHGRYEHHEHEDEDEHHEDEHHEDEHEHEDEDEHHEDEHEHHEHEDEEHGRHEHEDEDEDDNDGGGGGRCGPVSSPNYAVNTEGLRRGRRPVHSPYFLNEGKYEVDKTRMDRIRRKRHP